MKIKGMAYAVLGIAFAFLNVIAFSIPTEKTATYWIAYAFSTIAFALQIVVWKFAFKGKEPLKSKFLGIPLIAVGVSYLVIQIIAFTIFMAFPSLPIRVPIVVCSLLLAASTICLIGAEADRKIISHIEENVDKKRFYIKSLQADIELIAETEIDTEIKADLIKLAERIAFSDPMSSNALADIEAVIAEKINILKTSEDKQSIIADLNSLITERNKKVKLTK